MSTGLLAGSSVCNRCWWYLYWLFSWREKGCCYQVCISVYIDKYRQCDVPPFLSMDRPSNSEAEMRRQLRAVDVFDPVTCSKSSRPQGELAA